LKHLGKLSEELAECAEAAMEFLTNRADARAAGGKTYTVWLEDELADVVANVVLVERHFGLKVSSQIEDWGRPTAHDGLLIGLTRRLSMASQAVARAIIQGLDGREPTTGRVNRDWLEGRLRRLPAPIYAVTEAYGLDRERIKARAAAKMAQLRAWHAMLAPNDVGGGRMSCDHAKFAANVDVTRMTAGEGGPVTGYMAELRIRCEACGQPFQFAGLLRGVNLAEPRCSFDGTEARLPLTPFDEAAFRAVLQPAKGTA